MSKIVLATLNARYIHSSLGLRYLYANLGELQAECEIQEYVINERVIDIAEKILACDPQIIGVGVYIWNVEQSTQLISLLRSIRPDLHIIVGGPEASHEQASLPFLDAVDYIISGQADLSFREVCAAILANEPPAEKLIAATAFKLEQLQLPYRFYTDEDVRNRVIYVEASRGCPFKCEFCLSALDKSAWAFDLEQFLQEMDLLYQRGVRHFKFVDRTFNLKIASSMRIMEFFLGRLDENLFLHFELIPDHLPEPLRELIQRFPDGTLQFEIGIQSFDPQVQALISRRQDNVKAEENIRFLREQTHAHLHTDLIIGLPGEGLESFARGFDRLYALRPHEIQVGILKRLRGAPLARHTADYKLVFSSFPPYNILSTSEIDFGTMQRLSRFARYWDLIANSGRFKSTLSLILGDAPFNRFLVLSDWLYAVTDQTHRIALPRLFKLLYEGIQAVLDVTEQEVSVALSSDYVVSGLKGAAPFQTVDSSNVRREALPVSRQARHRP